MGASQFEQSAGALKRKYWWKNLKVFSLLFSMIHISFFNLLFMIDDVNSGWNSSDFGDSCYR